MITRHEINPNHPIFGKGWRMVRDDEPLPEWKNEIGMLVGDILGPNSLDANAAERIFRRRA